MAGKIRPAWLWGGVALAVALVAGGFYAWQQRQAGAQTVQTAPAGAAKPAGPRMGPGAAVQPVSVGVVRRQNVRVLVSAIGTMNARATAVVRAKVSGELQSLHFQEGQEVKAGQLLAQIDARSFQATLDQARGSLLRDQALLQNAKLDLQRYRDLLAQDSIARQQVDTQAALVRQYEGVVASDQAQVDMARLQLSYTQVTAPIAGRLGLRQADRGNVVNPGDANGIVTITQTRPIDAVFALPEAHLDRITRRLAEGAVLPVELWDRDARQRLAQGRLRALDNAIDMTTGTIKVKAAFANEDGQLFPNQFVNVKLQLDVLPQALTVPGTAVQNNYVYLVQPDGKVTQRRIRVGVADGDRVSVEGELAEGDQVVTDGIDRLREGTQVQVIDSGVADKADQAAQNAGQRRAAFLQQLTPEQRQKLAQMSPEERRAFIRSLRAKQEGEGKPAPTEAAPTASGAASTPAPAARP